VCLAQGIGIERNERKATEWFRRAADGLVDAQYWYGRMLVDGHGVPASEAEGREWVARAAAAGLVEAEVALAELLICGRGGPRDPPAARMLLERAAQKENAAAMFGLGVMYHNGYDTAVDYKTALHWFLAAARHGHSPAQVRVGQYLAYGTAGKRDPERARIWLKRAIDQGSAEARDAWAAMPPSPEGTAVALL
jgi:uncharacterized protein